MQQIWEVFNKLFNFIWKSLNLFRELVMNIFFILIILFCIWIWIHINNNQTQNIKHGALLLDINGIIVDKPSYSGISIEKIRHQLFTTNHIQENSLFEIVNSIRRAKNDNNITGIVLFLKNLSGADQPSMQYIGKALLEFRSSGKPIIAIGNSYSQIQYYLASFANKIWLSPSGEVDLHGFSTNRFYYRLLLDKLKITTHVFRVGTYKSAVEPFIRNNISPASRADDSHWINELWKNYVSTIASNRQININQVFPGAKILLDDLRKNNGDKAKYALNTKLVDELGTNFEIEKYLIKQFGWNEKDKKYNAISIYDYVNKNSIYNYITKKSDNIGRIAVIFVNGPIIDGDGEEVPGSSVGGDAVAVQIRNARLDSKVKAIILRVNSPGGSVNASEVIRNELLATRKIGKPIIVSMGSLAASGGYWISTPANYIIASPNTLSGSIGIFGIINTIEKSLDYIGIHNDGVSTSPLADITISKTLPSEAIQIMQLNIKNGYKRFIKLVAESRNKTPEQVNQIAQGHIWTGQDAKNNGLIDSLGDFDNAIDKAVELSNMKKWNINYYQDRLTLFDLLINNISSLIQSILFQIFKNNLLISTILKSNLIQARTNELSIFKDPQNCYAFCLVCANIY